MEPALFRVDAFCGPELGGNPGVVYLMPQEQPAEWMQSVASHTGASESGFLRRLEDAEFALRWFSPAVEVPLCGHVTLAAAHVLWNEVHAVQGDRMRFRTASGVLEAHRTAGGIELSMPINRCSAAPTPGWLVQALRVAPVRFLAGDRKYLVEVASESAVASLAPDFELIRHRADRGIIVTARADDPRYDIVSRYFGGYVGVDEDSVTATAHCCLVPYWSERLGKADIRARQLSARGGELRGSVAGERVRLLGAARTAWHVSVRIAQERDVEGICACLETAFAPYWGQYTQRAYADTVPDRLAMRLRLGNSCVFVAAHGDRIVGTVGVAPHHEAGHLRGMAVLPEWQGRGVSALLLQAALGHCRHRGYRHVTLGTTEPLQRAMRFYLRQGFVASGQISDFFGMPLREYILRVETLCAPAQPSGVLAGQSDSEGHRCEPTRA